MSEYYRLGNNVEDLYMGDVPANISRVNLNVDSETYYTSGDDTGRTLEVSCPWGTQAMADSILAKVGAYVYRPYSADNAILSPAVELGDPIIVGGVHSIVATMDVDISEDKKMHAASISAPELDEIDDEYPYENKGVRAIERKLATTRSLITKTASEIRLGIEDTANGLTTLFGMEIDSIEAKVEEQGESITQLRLDTDSISASVSDLETGMSQTVRIAADGVTITNAAGSTLTIDGGQIDAENLNLSGRITFGDLASDAQGEINDAYALAATADGNASDALDYAESALNSAGIAQDTADAAASDIQKLADGEYTGGTFINGRGIISPVFYATDGAYSNYGELDSDSLGFYMFDTSCDNYYRRKIALQYGENTDYGFDYAELQLGHYDGNQARVLKRVTSDGNHQLWVGNNGHSVGVLFDFTAGTYKFYGTGSGGSSDGYAKFA